MEWAMIRLAPELLINAFRTALDFVKGSVMLHQQYMRLVWLFFTLLARLKVGGKAGDVCGCCLYHPVRKHPIVQRHYTDYQSSKWQSLSRSKVLLIGHL